jgi:hypothetical protein
MNFCGIFLCILPDSIDLLHLEVAVHNLNSCIVCTLTCEKDASHKFVVMFVV